MAKRSRHPIDNYELAVNFAVELSGFLLSMSITLLD